MLRPRLLHHPAFEALRPLFGQHRKGPSVIGREIFADFAVSQSLVAPQPALLPSLLQQSAHVGPGVGLFLAPFFKQPAVYFHGFAGCLVLLVGALAEEPSDFDDLLLSSEGGENVPDVLVALEKEELAAEQKGEEVASFFLEDEP